jgi:two-component system, LuxR family, response regulator FixJ
VARPLISVVDDDESVRESLESLIKSVGLGVKTFASAEAFLESEVLVTTDCVITDVRMPGMGGLDLQRRLAISQRHLPVIFITAHGSDEDVAARALRAGAVDYLLKPLTEDAVLGAVNTALARKNEKDSRH